MNEGCLKCGAYVPVGRAYTLVQGFKTAQADGVTGARAVGYICIEHGDELAAPELAAGLAKS